MTTALEKIHQEHKDLGHVLTCLKDSVKALRDGKTASRLELIQSALYYVRMFPERFHHPKEEMYLFAALRKRTQAFAPVLDELKAQHEAGDRQIGEVETALKHYEADPTSQYEAFAQVADAFVAQQFAHMKKEENEVLPLAEDTLLPEDWEAIDQAFRSNADPMFGENLEVAYHALHNHIMNLAEAAR